MSWLNFVIPLKYGHFKAMKIFENRLARVAVQMVFWICLHSIMVMFFYGFFFFNQLFTRNLIILSSTFSIILWNTYFLVPQFFARKKYKWYAINLAVSVVSLILLTNSIDSFFLISMQEQMKMAPFIFHERNPFMRGLSPDIPASFLKLTIFTAAAMASTVLESVQIHLHQEQLASKIKLEKQETEMKFLKSQINPHFLFNVLNNVYTLSLLKSAQTPEVVMKLSEMLRYMLYDSNRNLVPLETEINYIRNFIDLQRLKDDQTLAVNTTFTTQNNKAMIAPMILIPFVENAFKHSKVEDLKNGWINMQLNGSSGTLHFKISNSIPLKGFTKDQMGGIGLTNVQRRLELQYPDRHQLAIQKNSTQFDVSLKIQLA